MKIDLEILSSVAIKRRKPWDRLIWLGQEKENLVLLDNYRASFLFLSSGKTKKKIPKVENYVKNGGFSYVTNDGGILVWLLFSGNLIIWQKDVDFIWTIEGSKSLISSLASRNSNISPCKHFVFVSTDIETVLVVNHCQQIFLWERKANMVANTKLPLLHGVWTEIKTQQDDYQIPSFHKELEVDVTLVHNSFSRKLVISSFVYIVEDFICISTLHLERKSRLSVYDKLTSSTNFEVHWTDQRVNFSDIGASCTPLLHRGTFVIRYCKSDALLAIAINQKNAFNSVLIFTNPLLQTHHVISLRGCGAKLDASANSRYFRIADMKWMCNDTLLVCITRQGSFGLISRLGEMLTISTDGYQMNFGPSTYLCLHPRMRVSTVQEKSNRGLENPESPSLASSISEMTPTKQRFSLAVHPRLPVFLASDGYLVTCFLLPTFCHVPTTLLEMMILSADFSKIVQKPMQTINEVQKFNLIQDEVVSSDENSTATYSETVLNDFRSGNGKIVFDEANNKNEVQQELTGVQQELTLKSLSTAWGLIVSMPEFIVWDEKLELLANSVVENLLEVQENLLAEAIGSGPLFDDGEHNWKWSVGVIQSTVYHCLRLVRFDALRRNCLASSMKFVTAIITILLNHVEKVHIKTRTCYLEAIYTILNRAKILLSNTYDFTKSSASITEACPYAYHAIENVQFPQKTTVDYFEHKFRKIVQRLYKTMEHQFHAIVKHNMNKRHEETCKQLLCQLQLTLQKNSQSFRHKRGRVLLKKGVYEYLTGNVRGAIALWSSEVNEVLQEVHLTLPSQKKLERVLHSLLYTFLFNGEIKASLKLVNRLLKFESNHAPLTSTVLPEKSGGSRKRFIRLNTAPIQHLVLTLARFMSSYFANKSLKIYPPYKPKRLRSLIVEHGDAADKCIILSREILRTLICGGGNDVTNAWSVDVAFGLLLVVGAFSEAVWLAHTLGDWKIAFLTSVICFETYLFASKISDKREIVSHLKLPLSLLPMEIMVGKLTEDLLLSGNKVEDWNVHSTNVISVLRDHFNASILSNLEIVPLLLRKLVDHLLSLMKQLSFSIPQEFYLPSPPLFCPQDEAVLGTVKAKTEAGLRREIYNVIQTVRCVLTASNLLIPIAYLYVNDLNTVCNDNTDYSQLYENILRTFKEYMDDGTMTVILPQEYRDDPSIYLIQSAFCDLCSFVWLFHVRDNIELEWRHLWNCIEKIKPLQAQQNYTKRCVNVLDWAIHAKPFIQEMQWDMEFSQLVLTLALECMPSTKAVNLFAVCVPDMSQLPNECEFRAQMLMENWKLLSLKLKDHGKSPEKSIQQNVAAYYTDCCKMIRKDLNANHVNAPKVDARDSSFVSFLSLFLDLTVHKHVFKSEHSTPLLLCCGNETKNKELSIMPVEIARINPGKKELSMDKQTVVQNKQMKILEIETFATLRLRSATKYSNHKRMSFYSGSLTDLSCAKRVESSFTSVSKKSKSMENIGKHVNRSKQKKCHKADSIGSEFQVLSASSPNSASVKLQSIDIGKELNHLVPIAAWLERWAMQVHSFGKKEIVKEESSEAVPGQIRINATVYQILMAVDRIRERVEMLMERVDETELSAIIKPMGDTVYEEAATVVTKPNVAVKFFKHVESDEKIFRISGSEKNPSSIQPSNREPAAQESTTTQTVQRSLQKSLSVDEVVDAANGLPNVGLESAFSSPISPSRNAERIKRTLPPDSKSPSDKLPDIVGSSVTDGSLEQPLAVNLQQTVTTELKKIMETQHQSLWKVMDLLNKGQSHRRNVARNGRRKSNGRDHDDSEFSSRKPRKGSERLSRSRSFTQRSDVRSKESPFESVNEDDNTLNDATFPESEQVSEITPIQRVNKPTVHFGDGPMIEPRTIHKPVPIRLLKVNFPPMDERVVGSTNSQSIPNFLRLQAESEEGRPQVTNDENNADPRLRGGGCPPMPFPLLSLPQSISVQREAHNPVVASVPYIPHMGLPLLRLPQKYMSCPTSRQLQPACHVCLEDNTCQQNMHVQDLLRNYWLNVKQARVQQLTTDSLSRPQSPPPSYRPSLVTQMMSTYPLQAPVVQPHPDFHGIIPCSSSLTSDSTQPVSPSVPDVPSQPISQQHESTETDPPPRRSIKRHQCQLNVNSNTYRDLCVHNSHRTVKPPKPPTTARPFFSPPGRVKSSVSKSFAATNTMQKVHGCNTKTAYSPPVTPRSTSLRKTSPVRPRTPISKSKPSEMKTEKKCSPYKLAPADAAVQVKMSDYLPRPSFTNSSSISSKVFERPQLPVSDGYPPPTCTFAQSPTFPTSDDNFYLSSNSVPLSSYVPPSSPVIRAQSPLMKSVVDKLQRPHIATTSVDVLLKSLQKNGMDNPISLSAPARFPTRTKYDVGTSALKMMDQSTAMEPGINRNLSYGNGANLKQSILCQVPSTPTNFQNSAMQTESFALPYQPQTVPSEGDVFAGSGYTGVRAPLVESEIGGINSDSNFVNQLGSVKSGLNNLRAGDSARNHRASEVPEMNDNYNMVKQLGIINNVTNNLPSVSSLISISSSQIPGINDNYNTIHQLESAKSILENFQPDNGNFSNDSVNIAEDKSAGDKSIRSPFQRRETSGQDNAGFIAALTPTEKENPVELQDICEPILDFKMPSFGELNFLDVHRFVEPKLILDRTMAENTKLEIGEVHSDGKTALKQIPQTFAKETLERRLKSLDEPFAAIEEIATQMEKDLESSEQLLRMMKNFTVRKDPFFTYGHIGELEEPLNPEPVIEIGDNQKKTLHVTEAWVDRKQTVYEMDREFIDQKWFSLENPKSSTYQHFTQEKTMNPFNNDEESDVIDDDDDTNISIPTSTERDEGLHSVATSKPAEELLVSMKSPPLSPRERAVSRQLQKNVHFKMRMQGACELMKQLISPQPEPREASSKNSTTPTHSDLLSGGEGPKPKRELSRILNKIDANLKRELNQMRAYSGKGATSSSYVQTSSWTTSDDEATKKHSKKRCKHVQEENYNSSSQDEATLVSSHPQVVLDQLNHHPAYSQTGKRSSNLAKEETRSLGFANENQSDRSVPVMPFAGPYFAARRAATLMGKRIAVDSTIFEVSEHTPTVSTVPGIIPQRKVAGAMGRTAAKAPANRVQPKRLTIRMTRAVQLRKKYSAGKRAAQATGSWKGVGRGMLGEPRLPPVPGPRGRLPSVHQTSYADRLKDLQFKPNVKVSQEVTPVGSPVQESANVNGNDSTPSSPSTWEVPLEVKKLLSNGENYYY